MKATGIVIEGNKRATQIGFPTANIANLTNVPIGIYAARILIENKDYIGAAYVGTPQPEILEVHIIDLNEDLYGRKIEVEICDKIRDDIHETDNTKLKQMISDDIMKIKSLLYSQNEQQK